jgi:hypothetical protein
LRACDEAAEGSRSAPVAEYELVDRSKLQDPGPVLARLLRKEEIVPHSRTGCYAITYKGQETLRRYTLRGLRRRIFGG